MADFRIPDDLAQLLSQQRIIPFIGAGFSGVHGVPAWESLLRSLADEIQATADVQPVLTFDEIANACGNDNLQIAEYLYLIAGESIGPIRHGLSTALQSDTPLLESTPHVELVNLGAPHVYTTNFDDLIEKTYRELGLPVDVISVPRDMALSHADRTEIVKYHGDLRHEQTLVLTESQYYTRLEFESPMDLKFRSDLLGRSVLFMGYSFRDINIRVIWFRLMQMMKDVPLKDRPPSYIVRLRANPVLDALYRAVGLRTLVIDPFESATTADAQNALLSEFLMELSLRCSADGTIPGSERRAFASLGLIEQVEKQLDEAIAQASGPRARVLRMPDGRLVRRSAPQANGDIVATTPLLAALDRLKIRHITDPLSDRVADLLLRLAQTVNTVGSRPTLAAELASWFTGQRGASPGVTLLVARSLLRESPREALIQSTGIDWAKVWASKLPPSDVDNLLVAIQGEIEGHEEGEYEDADVAYGVDLAKRISEGNLIASDGEEAVAARDRAAELLSRAAALYPSVEEYDPSQDDRPEPREIRREVERKVAEQESGPDGHVED